MDSPTGRKIHQKNDRFKKFEDLREAGSVDVDHIGAPPTTFVVCQWNREPRV
jgi:hypothetical protein